MKLGKIFLLVLVVSAISAGLFHLVRIKESFPDITVATTTSVENSGLLDVLIPVFEKKYNCKVKIIACGSGQAIRLARDASADVIFVHDPEEEEKLIADGTGKKRYTVMYNSFVVVGPKSDKFANELRTCKTVFDVFNKIATTSSYFVSRADNSGTHKKELSIWSLLSFLGKKESKQRKNQSINQKIERYINSKYYLESGTGMAQTLYISNEKNAYCLTDTATYISHKKNLNALEVVFDNDMFLFNPYSVIPVVSSVTFRTQSSRDKLRQRLVNNFIEFITSLEAKEIIKNYGIKQSGEPLFCPM